MPQDIWLIRAFSSSEHFWDTIRDNTPYTISFKTPEAAHNAILKIIETETKKWTDCEAYPPKLEDLKKLIFRRFLSIHSKGINGDTLQIQLYVYKVPRED